MQQPKYVVGHTFEPTLQAGGWVCKRPSDGGSWVFVHSPNRLQGYHQYLIEVTGKSPSGCSRQGTIIWCVEDVLWELVKALHFVTWYRDHNGDPCARGIKVSVGTFDAYYSAGHKESGVTWDFGPHITFEPVVESPLRALKDELAEWLETVDATELGRAESAPFGPGVIPAVGKGQLVAQRLKHRSSA